MSGAIGRDTLTLFYFDFMRRGRPFPVDGAAFKPVRWCPGRVAQLAWKKLNWPPFRLFAGDADVYHFPNFVLPPLSRRATSVVTIHDMSFLRFPEFAEKKNLAYLSGKIRGTVSRADAVITDSRFSADEIQELLHVPQDRLFPIHLGVDEAFSPRSPNEVRTVLSDLSISQPYILTVGTLEPRKNVPFLLDVFEKLNEFQGTLVIAGMRGWKYEPILRRIRESSRADHVRYLEYVAEEQLPALYTGAEMLAITSLYEGFGLPPLEAMACGTPVLSSAGGSLAEVLDGGAVVLDEFDADLWVERAGELLFDEQACRRWTERGTSHAAQYQWGETARRTVEVYREVQR